MSNIEKFLSDIQHCARHCIIWKKMVCFLRSNFIPFMNVLDKQKYTSFDNQIKPFLKLL